jgi:hypothetical protein
LSTSGKEGIVVIAYLIAFVPVVIGAIQWVMSRRVVWWEWLVGSAVGFAISGMFHVIAVTSMANDVETWSGQVTHAVHYPYWHAKWTELETYTVGSGKNRQTMTRLVTKTRDYPEHWTAYVSYGSASQSYPVSADDFGTICLRFGVKEPRVVAGDRHNYNRGDKNDYWADNLKNEIIPANTSYSWENRVKAAPSGFSFAKVPDNAGVFEYPKNEDWRRSNRLLGTANGDFTTYEWDCMNSRLGPEIWANVITVGFGPGSSSDMGTHQEAKWFGGKKNDVVVCYGGTRKDGRPGWTYAFGWTEQEIVKRNLETIFLLNKPSNDLIPKIEAEILDNYAIKDWTKFDYLTVEPPWWSFLVLVIFMVVAQGGFWYFAHANDENKR